MKVHELIAELTTIMQSNPKEDILTYDIVTQELIGGFQENIEGVIITKDFFDDRPLIAITFRNQ